MKWRVIELEAIAKGLPCKNKAWSLYVTKVTVVFYYFSTLYQSQRLSIVSFRECLHREIKWNCLELNYSNQISAFLTVWAQWGLARQKLEMQAIASEN